MTVLAGFVLTWIVFTLVVVIGLVALWTWILRSGQLRDQEHARRLPLESDAGPAIRRRRPS
jgi:cbb3-type cytochrome oxidase subunit 3